MSQQTASSSRRSPSGGLGTAQSRLPSFNRSHGNRSDRAARHEEDNNTGSFHGETHTRGRVSEPGLINSSDLNLIPPLSRSGTFSVSCSHLVTPVSLITCGSAASLFLLWGVSLL